MIRKERGECEYLRVTELHESGWPHYHALLRSSYIPQRRLSEIWGTLTGAPVVWIAKIDQSFSTFRYLVKYLTKLHKIEWTDRHVSYSRGFFREEDLEKLAYPEKTVIERIDTHPWQWLSERYDCDQIAVDSSGNYHLPYAFCGKKHEHSRESLGLPPLDHEKPEPAKTQRALTGLADYDADTYADSSILKTTPSHHAPGQPSSFSPPGRGTAIVVGGSRNPPTVRRSYLALDLGVFGSPTTAARLFW